MKMFQEIPPHHENNDRRELEACLRPLKMGFGFAATVLSIAGLERSGMIDEMAAHWALEHPDAGFPSNGTMQRELEEAIGSPWEELGQQRLRRKAGEASQAERTIAPALNGFEWLGIDPLHVTAYLQKTLPRGWVSAASIRSITVNPHFVEMKYPGFEGRGEFGHCNRFFGGQPSEIEFTAESLKEPSNGDLLYLLKSLIHEGFHANDHLASMSLPTQSALQLDYALMRAVVDTRRPVYGYPEGILFGKGKTDQQVIASRMAEFGAELMTDALTFADEDLLPGIRSWETWENTFHQHLMQKRQASNEAAAYNVYTAKWLLTHVDPGYQPWVAMRERQSMVSEIMSDRHAKELLRVVEEMKDVALMHVVETALKAPRSAFKAAAIDDMRAEFRGSRPTCGKDREAVKQFLNESLAALRGQEEQEAFHAWLDLMRHAMKVRLEKWQDTHDHDFSMTSEAKKFGALWTSISNERKQVIRPLLLGYAQRVHLAPPRLEGDLVSFHLQRNSLD